MVTTPSPSYNIYMHSLVVANLQAKFVSVFIEAMMNFPQVARLIPSPVLLYVQGGLAAVQKRAESRAAAVYAALDASDGFYRNAIKPAFRSRMSVPFRILDGRQSCTHTPTLTYAHTHTRTHTQVVATWKRFSRLKLRLRYAQLAVPFPLRAAHL